MITVELTGDQDALTRLRAIPRGINRALAKTADEVFDFVERRVDSHTKTGAMRDSLFNRRDSETSYTIGHDLSRAPYAVFVHWGSRPHVIEPRNRRVLRWPSGGAFAFARRVNHPGYAGDAYLVDAAREVPAIFARHMQSIIEGN